MACQHKNARINQKVCFDCRTPLRDFIQHKCEISLCPKCNEKLKSRQVVCDKCFIEVQKSQNDILHELIKGRRKHG